MQEDHRGKEIDLEETVAVHTLESHPWLRLWVNVVSQMVRNDSSVSMLVELIARNSLLLHVKSKFSTSWVCVGMGHKSNYIKSTVSAIIFAIIVSLRMQNDRFFLQQGTNRDLQRWQTPRSFQPILAWKTCSAGGARPSCGFAICCLKLGIYFRLPKLHVFISLHEVNIG